jgi:hypothetical protein
MVYQGNTIEAYLLQFFYNTVQLMVNIFVMGATGFGSIFGKMPILIGGFRTVEVNFPDNYNP